MEQSEQSEQDLDISGEWHCCYWYENTKHNNCLDTSEYTVTIERSERGFVLHSRPNEDGSHLEARLKVDANMVMGTWLENTAPSGEWAGMMYKGAVQLLANDDGSQLKGLWIATVHNNANPKVSGGRWEMTRITQ